MFYMYWDSQPSDIPGPWEIITHFKAFSGNANSSDYSKYSFHNFIYRGRHGPSSRFGGGFAGLNWGHGKVIPLISGVRSANTQNSIKENKYNGSWIIQCFNQTHISLYSFLWMTKKESREDKKRTKRTLSHFRVKILQDKCTFLAHFSSMTNTTEIC